MISTPLPAAGAVPTVDRRQPRALPWLFLTEMWERFSYYGMRALLVLYLVKAVGYSRAEALQVYATYTGLVYLTPIFGGYIADRLLGYRKSILVGGTVMMFGNAAMAVPGLLHLALGLLVVGNGFFKANMATLVGQQYGQNDPRRDAGFTYFYMGINIGAGLAALLAGGLGERVGWNWGFASAAVGMALGVSLFARGQSRFGTTGLPPGREGPAHLLPRDWLQVALLSVGAIPFVYAVLALLHALVAVWAIVPAQASLALPVIALGWLLWSAQRGGGRQDLERVLAILVLGMFNVFFWMGFEQAGGTMSLFADQLTDRALFGWQMPATFFQAINPAAIILFGPVLSAFWTRIDGMPRAPSSPTKMAIGLIILGLGFSILAIAQRRADQLGPVSPLWLTGVYVVNTIGELCISPVGLSMVTRVAPVQMGGLMMGVWYGSFSIGNYLAGTSESLLAETKIPLYQFLVGSSIGAGLVLLAVVPLLRRWMHGRA
ncbi:MAG TPA: peptide MFS transporter [Burkholderiaceae bacterium]|nr:peptide MFS transporter [Burkholderiaceae bacterium]